jgi:hypothetical protein
MAHNLGWREEEQRMQTETESWATAQQWETSNSKADLWMTVSVVMLFAGMNFVLIYGYFARPGWVGVAGKTFWDYFELLLPVIVATQIQYFGQRITSVQDMRQRRDREESRQDAAVEAYIDQTTSLAINIESRDQEEGNKTRALAWARTRRVLELIDAARKGSIVRFLYDARLIQGKRPTISLDEVNLRSANLSDAELSSAKLSRANLSRANLSGADLSGADLSGADLSGAEVTHEQLAQAGSLEGATIPNGLKYEAWLNDQESSEDSREIDRDGP